MFFHCLFPGFSVNHLIMNRAVRPRLHAGTSWNDSLDVHNFRKGPGFFLINLKMAVANSGKRPSVSRNLLSVAIALALEGCLLTHFFKSSHTCAKISALEELYILLSMTYMCDFMTCICDTSTNIFTKYIL